MDRRRKVEIPTHRSAKRGAVFWLALALFLGTTAAGGCRALPEYRSGASAIDSRVPPALDFASITAVPTKRGIYREINRLEAMRAEPAARLRRAFLLAEISRSDEAMTELNSLLFGDIDHGPTVESYARYLRAEVFARRGEADQAKADRRIALARAIDPQLRTELETVVQASDATTVAASSIRNLKIRPRSAWKARRATSMDPMGRVFRTTVHHSAILARDRSERAAIASIQAIQRNHQDRNGWSDLGYHYLIDAAGRVWEGRESRWQGAHAGGPEKNRGNIGICMLGNFIDGGQRPSREQEATLEAVIHWLQRRHGFDNRAILTHGELKVTDCPGRNLQVVVNRLRSSPAAAASGR